MADINSHDSRGQAVFVVTTTTFVLATVFVIARLVSRFGVLRSRTADDWVIILAWVLAFGLSFSICYGTSKGLGRRDEDIKNSWLPDLRKSEYAFTILYNPTLMATKTSILIFYLRMSKNTQLLLRVASYITLAIVNIAGLVLTFLNVFQCSPTSAAWDPTQVDPKCLSIVTIFLCSAPVNIITDLAILILPIPVLTGMRLPQRQKAVLVGTFALGIFVTIVDVVRIYYLQQAVDNQVATHAQLGTGTDFAWNASTALMWSAVEVNVGIVCACVPTLKPLIKRILPSMITDRSRSGTATDKTASSGSQAGNENDGRTNEPSHRMSPIAEPIPALPPAQHGGGQEAEMDMMDFLTMPGMDPGSINRTQTARTHQTDNTVYFGFVNMRRPKSMLKTRGKESFKYCTLVTILFFLWGFSYGLLNTLNNQIAKVAGESVSQTLGLSSAYFGAYFFGALTVGQWVLRKGGFKATFITGLCIYGTGTLMFWPSAVLSSFPGFIISNFVVGFGLAVLETAANPFLALCGASKHAEFRLLLAQSVQGTGSVLSNLLAEKVLFGRVGNKIGLIDVQWTYLAVALFTVILALFFYYMPLPEASDTDLQMQSEDQGIYRSQTVFSSRLPLIYTTLSLAVFAQFCYVAGQESMSVWFGALLTSRGPNQNLTLTVNNYSLVGHTTFTLGRFLFAALCLIIPPRLLLLIAYSGSLLFIILTMSLNISANGIAGPALIFFFFEGPIWPLVFALGLRGMGRRTKTAAALLTASASGGAVFPFIMLAVQRLNHKTVSYSYCVVVALFALGVLYPIYLTFVPKAKYLAQPYSAPGLPNSDLEDDERPETPIRRLSRRFSVMFEKIKGPKGRDSQEAGFVEHRERGSLGSIKSLPLSP